MGAMEGEQKPRVQQAMLPVKPGVQHVDRDEVCKRTSGHPPACVIDQVRPIGRPVHRRHSGQAKKQAAIYAASAVSRASRRKGPGCRRGP